MLSQDEFITLYHKATPETQKVVREILELPEGHDKEAVRQILITNGVEQEIIDEWERKCMPVTV